MPLLEVVKTVLAAARDLVGESVEASVVLLYSLLDDDPDRGGGKTEHERDEPERIHPDRVSRCDERRRTRDEIVVRRLSRVHKRGGGTKAGQLVGDLSEERIRLIRSGWLQELV